jgi:FKBP-type peptidyl-prolyl cis-trans isomerase FkpA
MPRVISFVLLASLVAYGCGDSSTGPSSTPPPRGEFSQTDLTVGTGATATTGRFLSVNYSGWLYDPAQLESKGRHFQTGSHSFTLGIGAVIRGWDQGVPGMRVGGRRRLVIPPELGYGANGSSDGTIPPNASLVFDVELLAVQ